MTKTQIIAHLVDLRKVKDDLYDKEIEVIKKELEKSELTATDQKEVILELSLMGLLSLAPHLLIKGQEEEGNGN
jgi:GTPase involved in cell partitioning and DNA repair